MIAGLISLLAVLAFLAPPVIKLQKISLDVVVQIGAGMAAYDDECRSCFQQEGAFRANSIQNKFLKYTQKFLTVTRQLDLPDTADLCHFVQSGGVAT